MSGCVRKVLGHFNIVIIIIIEIKQHSSSRHKELPALLLLRAWPKLFSVSRLYILCSTFSQLVGCFTALFFCFLVSRGFWFFVFIFTPLCVLLFGPESVLPCVYLYKRLLANLQGYEDGGYNVRGSFPPFWRQFSVGCRRLRLPVIIYGLHICLDFVLLLQLVSRHNEVG